MKLGSLIIDKKHKKYKIRKVIPFKNDVSNSHYGSFPKYQFFFPQEKVKQDYSKNSSKTLTNRCYDLVK